MELVYLGLGEEQRDPICKDDPSSQTEHVTKPVDVMPLR